MSDTSGTPVEDHSSEITLQEILRNSSKKVRRNDSNEDLGDGVVGGGEGEVQHNGDVSPEQGLEKNIAASGVHERLTGTYMYAYGQVIVW